MSTIAYARQVSLYEALFNERARQWIPIILRTLHALLPFIMLALFLFAPEMARAEGGVFDKIGKVMKEFAQEATDSGWMTWIGVLAIAVGGLLFSVGELNGPFGYVIRIVAGLAAASGATALGTAFVGGPAA